MNNRISQQPTHPTPEYITVTPEMALDWLTSNEANRPLRSYKVNDYIRDIEAGHWYHSNDGICLSTDGTLLNGQHRLTAILESGLPAVLLVIRDMPLEAMIAMDRGTGRTTADLLGFRGHKNNHSLGAVVKLIIIVESGRIYSDTRLQRATDSEVEEFLAVNPLVEHIVSYVSSIKAHIDCSPSVLGLVYWLIQQANGTSLAEFYLDQLATRENEPSGSAVLAVDSRLRSIRRDHARYPRRDLIHLLIRGWNHYATDHRVTTLAMNTRGEFNLPEVKKWNRGEIRAVSA